MKRAAGAVKTLAVYKTLAGHLTLTLIGLMAAALWLLTGLLVTSDLSHQADARWTQASLAADMLAAGAEAAAVAHDSAGAASDLRLAAHMPGVTYARIEAHDGSTLAEAGRRPSGVPLDSEHGVAPIKTLLSPHILQVRAPVMRRGHQVGQVVIGHKAKISLLTPVMLGVAMVWLAAFGVALWMELRLRRQVSLPLKALDEAIQTAGNNDFSARVPTQGQAEIAALATHFNDFLNAMHWRDRRLEDHMLGLEAAVAACSAELETVRTAEAAALNLKSDFLATADRDLIAPMTGAVIMAEHLATENLPAHLQRQARALAETGRFLLGTLRDSLDFVRIEGGEIDIETAELDILECVDTVLALYQAKAREKGIELVASAHPEAPRLVPADPVRLAQVLSSLVSNAIAFTAKGHVLVSIETDRKPGFWRLVVRDTGKGIARDRLGGLFSAETGRAAGRGLGLSLAKRLVEAMGGAIAVTSEPGKGAQFHVRMPTLDYAPPGIVNLCAPPVIHDLVRPVVHVLVEANLERDVLSERLRAANIRFGPDRPRLVLADAAYRDTLSEEIEPDILVLLAHADDTEAAQWVREGRAAAVLPRPLRHRDIDALIERLRDEGDFRLYDTESDPEGVDAAWPQAQVLVADDDGISREVTIEALARFGIAAEVAADGAEALAMMQGHDFDLVLMDGVMPVMNGFDAARQWRAQETDTHLPIIALMGQTSASGWQDAGMDGVLHKPFTLRDLALVLNAHLPDSLRTKALPRAGKTETPVLAPVSLPADGDLFDPVMIASLVDGLYQGRGDFVRRVVTLYQNHAPEAVATLQTAHAEGDDDRLARAAHALKAMSLNIGAKTVADVAAAIERAVRVEHRAVAGDEIAMTAAWVERTLTGLAGLVAPSGTVTTRPSLTPEKPAAVTGADPEAALAREIEADIEAGAFEMEYQPILDRQGAEIVGAEALMRWRRGDRAPVGPAVFIPVAERCGLITRLGTFARRRVLEHTADWNIPVAINVSPIELDKPGFVAGLRALLDDTGFDPRRLTLEVTETAFLGESDRVRQLFNDLRALGTKLALDDFGVGYSSLTALHRFPFDRIKIDREFVMALDGEPRAALEALAIIQAVTGIGRAFGMQVTAEGIETASQHSHLRTAGVHTMQGYLFGKAMPAEAFGRLIGKPVLQRA